AALGVLGVSVLLALLWLEHGRLVTLPMPTGSFAVGRSIFTWKDDAAPETLAPVPGAKRELLVWMWYPAAAVPSAAVTDDYVPVAMREAAARDRGAQTLPGLLMSDFLTRDPSQVRTHSLRDADVSPRQRSYPVVVMRAGASAGVTNYTTLAEDLAS